MTLTQTTNGHTGRKLREVQPLRTLFAPSTPTFAAYDLTGEESVNDYVRRERAVHRFLGREVIIQQLLPTGTSYAQRLSSFVQSISAQAALRHPGLARVWDAGISNEQPFAVLERPQGLTLDEHLGLLAEHGGGLAVADALAMIDALADLMQTAHANNVLLNNLTPTTIVVTSDGAPVLLALGTPAATAALREDPILQAFTAPERLTGGSADERSDIYMLGALLYFVLTGRALFHDSGDEVVSQKLSAEPVFVGLADDPSAVELLALLRKATARQADQRYQSVAHLRADLEVLMYDQASRATEDVLLDARPLIELEVGAPQVKPSQLAPLVKLPQLAPLVLPGRDWPTHAKDVTVVDVSPSAIPGAEREEFRGALPYSILVPLEPPASYSPTAPTPHKPLASAGDIAAGIPWLMLLVVVAVAIGTAWMLG